MLVYFHRLCGVVQRQHVWFWPRRPRVRILPPQPVFPQPLSIFRAGISHFRIVKRILDYSQQIERMDRFW